MTTSLVVSDIENTVFDWAGIWANAFDALIARLAAETGIAADEWLERARAAHVRRGAAECPALLDDLAAADTWPPGVDRHAVLMRAAAGYRRYWDLHLAPYAGVRDAFVDLVQRDVVIVGYTESDVALTAARLTRMGLAGVIRQVFGRVGGAAATHREYALIDSASRCAIGTDVIPYHDNKPNPAGLDSILKRCTCTPDRALYLGDNLWNDVAMAQRAGVRALWAQYGTARTPEQRTLLQRVANWPGLEPAAGRGATADTVRPDATLNHPADLVAFVHGVSATAA